MNPALPRGRQKRKGGVNRHKKWMGEALALAWKGRERTSPNPLVGAVVVKKGRKVGEGYHAFFGGPHAEVLALRKAGKRAKGAALYVTFEPCSTWGKTPPCVDRVIESQIKEVVIGSPDPNPQNHGQGIQKLRKAKIRVSVGCLAREVEQQNLAFFKAMRTGLPYITLKMAQSLDGKIATPTGESRWISSGAARRFVRKLRDNADAVLVGKNTALKDNPRLHPTPARRDGVNGRQKPWRVVLDPHLEIPDSARLFRGPQLTFVAVSERHLSRLHPSSVKKGRIFLPVPEKKGALELKPLFRELTSLGVHQLLVEGGGELAWSLLCEGLVDRLIWIVAPKILGGREAKTSVEGEGIQKIARAFPLKWEKSFRLGEDWIFEAYVYRHH